MDTCNTQRRKTEKIDRELFVFASQKPLIRIYKKVIQILRISIEKQVAVLIGMPWKSTYCKKHCTFKQEFRHFQEIFLHLGLCGLQYSFLS